MGTPLANPYMSLLPSHLGLAIHLEPHVHTLTLCSCSAQGSEMPLQGGRGVDILRFCVQLLSVPLSHAAASLIAQGLDSSQPSSVRHHVALVLPALDIDAAVRLQRDHRIWKV